MAEANRPEDVLDFWFEEIDQEAWFKKSDAFDALLAARFGSLHARAAAGDLDTWTETRNGRLALILVLDQMSRNLFREDGRAFEQDERALEIARQAVAAGDHAVSAAERCLFLFLPFEHSEDIADQRLCRALFGALGNPYWVEFAARHEVIIERFGRFPHRNAVLARDTTPEEAEFLAQPGSSF